jgi:transposase InsO family protein
VTIGSTLARHVRKNGYPSAADFFTDGLQDAASSATPEGFYAPINIEGHDVVAFIDTGANVSAFSLSFLRRAELENDIEPPAPGEPTTIDGFNEAATTKRIGTVTCAIAAHGKGTRTHAFEVIDGDDEVIIGTDLFDFIGIHLVGVPTKFPDDNKGQSAFLQAAEAEELLRRTMPPWGLEDQIDKDEYAWLQQAIAPALAENAARDRSQPACVGIPEATMRLPLNIDASYRHQYRTPQAAQAALDAKVQHWHEHDIIEPGDPNSNFNSALLAAAKKDLAGNKTKWRICIDFRHINAALTENFNHASERMPHLHEALATTSGFTHASAIDLEESFHQLPVHEDDRDKTTFTHRGQRWRCKRWPFGLNPASLRFQKIMEVVLDGLEDVTVVWIDDVLIHTKGTVEQHAEAVTKVLQRLSQHGLRINVKKCHFGFRRVLMLGHYLSGETRSIDPLKAKTAADWPTPTTGKHIERLLGFGNFVRDYVINYARLTKPLEQLKKVKKFALEDYPAAERAFRNLRHSLGSAPVLHEPNRELPLLVATDASRHGLGAVLYQEDASGKRRYIAFASGSLKGAQKNYGATKRELLGIIFALKSFHNYLCGRHFTLFTDHKALTALFTVKRLSYVLQDWLDTLLQYDFDCVHRPGVQMIMPDTLSRIFDDDGGHDELEDDGGATRIIKVMKIKRESQDSDNALLQAAEPDDNDLRPLRKPIKLNELARYPERELAAFINERFEKTCPPVKQREELVNRRHTEAHFGAEALFRTLWREGYFWPGMRSDCAERVSKCRSCIQYNIGREGFHPVRSLTADQPFDHIAVDSMELPAASRDGYKYVLILVDVLTRYLITRPLKTLSMDEMARTLEEIFTLFGPPKIMQSDNGSEYVNALVAELCIKANVEHRTAAPRNPRANGLAETYVGVAKKVLKKVLSGNLDGWNDALAPMTLGINKNDGKLSKTAAFTMFYARAANPWTDYTLASVLGPDAQATFEAELEKLPDYDTLQLDEQKATMRDFKNVTLVALAKRTAEARQKTNSALDKKRKQIVRSYPRNSTVYIKNEDYASKFDPLWIGPFSVTRKSKKSGCYKLVDVDGEKLKRPVPVSKIKWVSDHDIELLDNDSQTIEQASERGVVKQIIKTKRVDGQTNYLVEWKNAQEPNEWLTADAFDDPSSIANFWRGQQPTRKKRKATQLEAVNQQPSRSKNKKQKPKPPQDQQRDFDGSELEVPATWFGVAYAKETYGKKKYKKQKERAVVFAKAGEPKDCWLIKLPDSDEPDRTFSMREDAIIKYGAGP